MPTRYINAILLAVVVGLVGLLAFLVGQAVIPGQTSETVANIVRDGKFGFRALNPGEDVNSYVRSQMGICLEIGNNDQCYKDVADLFFGQLGTRTTLGIFKETEGSQEVFARCHEATHYVGRLTYSKLDS